MRAHNELEYYSYCRNWKEQALGPGRAREKSEAVESPSQSSVQVESTEDRGGGIRKTKQRSSSTSTNMCEPKPNSTVPGDLTKHQSYSTGSKDCGSEQYKDEPEPGTTPPEPETPVIVVTESQNTTKEQGGGMASHSLPQDNSEKVAEKEAEEELGEIGEQQIEKEEMMAETGKRKSIKVKVKNIDISIAV